MYANLISNLLVVAEDNLEFLSSAVQELQCDTIYSFHGVNTVLTELQAQGSGFVCLFLKIESQLLSQKDL